MWCEASIEECFAPLSVIARRVEEVKAELLERKGIAVQHVIMTSDEKDVAWWQGVSDLGWLRVDYSMDQAMYGTWHVSIFLRLAGVSHRRHYRQECSIVRCSHPVA
jgi:hypothetical protein